MLLTSVMLKKVLAASGRLLGSLKRDHYASTVLSVLSCDDHAQVIDFENLSGPFCKGSVNVQQLFCAGDQPFTQHRSPSQSRARSALMMTCVACAPLRCSCSLASASGLHSGTSLMSSATATRTEQTRSCAALRAFPRTPTPQISMTSSRQRLQSTWASLASRRYVLYLLTQPWSFAVHMTGKIFLLACATAGVLLLKMHQAAGSTMLACAVAVYPLGALHVVGCQDVSSDHA